jgi:3'-phosphoadenosine 5'-phosphosulfate sulfotransferase (PAPS reductase)/FAD synthetase
MSKRPKKPSKAFLEFMKTRNSNPLLVKPSQWGKVKHHHFALSGGRTSGRMLREWLDCLGGVPANSSVLFCNTGREEDATLDFLHEMEVRWGVPITWLEYDRVPAADIDLGIFPTPRRRQYVERQAKAGEDTHWFRVVSYETAHRIGDDGPSPFDKLLEWMSVLPNPRVRACSAQMKSRAMLRYLWSRGVYEFTSYIGYRADEMDRAAELLASKDLIPGNTFSFPLIDWGITEPQVMDFWEAQPFDLGIEQFEGNCDLCFMKSVPKRVEIMRRSPERAAWWSGWEDRKSAECDGLGGRFRAEQSYADLLERARISLATVTPEGDCEPCGACTTGTLEWREDEE